MFEWSKDNIEQNNKDKKHPVHVQYNKGHLYLFILFHGDTFIGGSQLSTGNFFMVFSFTTRRSQLMSRKKHMVNTNRLTDGQYKQIDRRKTVFKRD